MHVIHDLGQWHWNKQTTVFLHMIIHFTILFLKVKKVGLGGGFEQKWLKTIMFHLSKYDGKITLGDR